MLGAGAMTRAAWSRHHVEVWGKNVPGRGNGKCRSFKEKCAWHVNKATYAGSLAWNPGPLISTSFILLESRGIFKNLEAVMSPLSQWSKRVFTLLLSFAFLWQRER